MPAPVISSVQSVLGFPQWQPWVFQPFATNSPTSWTSTPLPPGVIFNPATGRLTGPATMPGVYLFALQASNVAGISEPKQFALGIEATGYVKPANILEVFIDVVTRVVSLHASLADVQAGGANTAAQSTAANAADTDPKKLEPLFWVKAGDDLIFNIRFLKGTVPVDLALTGLRFALKQYEPEAILVDSAAAAGVSWAKVGLGADTSFRLAVKVDGDALRGALADVEDDTATQFLALGEFEWTETNTYLPLVGPGVLRSSSRTIGVMLPRDIVPNPA